MYELLFCACEPF